MNKATIIFSIDDGRKDMYQLAKEILIPKKVPATLNITTNDAFFAEKNLPKISKEELLEIGQCPFLEIANHADMHSNETDDILKGFETLCDWFGYDKTKPLGFASPYSHMTMEYAREHEDALQELGIKYVRTHKEGYYFNKEDDVYALASYGLLNKMPVQELKDLADEAVEKKYCLIYLLHSVLKPGEYNYENDYSYDFDKFNELVDYILELQKEGKVDIMTTADYVDKRISGRI